MILLILRYYKTLLSLVKQKQGIVYIFLGYLIYITLVLTNKMLMFVVSGG